LSVTLGAMRRTNAFFAIFPRFPGQRLSIITADRYGQESCSAAALGLGLLNRRNRKPLAVTGGYRTRYDHGRIRFGQVRQDGLVVGV
jgi:hypothetical protein